MSFPSLKDQQPPLIHTYIQTYIHTDIHTYRHIQFSTQLSRLHEMYRAVSIKFKCSNKAFSHTTTEGNDSASSTHQLISARRLCMDAHVCISSNKDVSQEDSTFEVTAACICPNFPLCSRDHRSKKKKKKKDLSHLLDTLKIQPCSSPPLQSYTY